MENIDGQLLEYYATYNKVINEDYLYMSFSNFYHGNVGIIYTNINNRIRRTYTTEEYIAYINVTDKNNLVQYINELKNLYDNYKKMIMEDNYNELVEIININEHINDYIMNIILGENKLDALNLILETYDRDKINDLLLELTSNLQFIDIVTIFINHGVNISSNYNCLLSQCVRDNNINNVKFLLENDFEHLDQHHFPTKMVLISFFVGHVVPVLLK